MQHLVWDLDPVFFSIGPLTVHWYGVLFATAILSGLQVMKWIFQQEQQDLAKLDNLLVYIVIGVIVGARLGHCFFYEPGYYFANPLKIFAIWEGGLASHGGGLGAIIAAGIYSKKHQLAFSWLLDRLAICTALFGFFVRSANFVNSEILGTVSNVPWAIIFARIDNVPRHPSQLYEAIAYLTIFFALLIFYKQKKAQTPSGSILGIFLILVFSARFLIEMIKEKQAAYTADIALTAGQMLSIPFFLAGVALVIWSYNNHKDSK
ncbi:Prolipoprotein diacylglyceryl transferase [Colwellia chukchiensis]|uniref:Phosphatidylglycerol--prolipoprotein diacylglyceryl transferase n=1 Tax=Colwellia chukchiensis TaxID=641665 RepID=A0A1H7R4T5_9GAMM|nr:prolipoprotein diacylglyceryl transferase [Colwellia chukchiensis]SEL54557.1 Prolipoprotein diacylglyceryl transferase [Colwellia chukchiensis]